MPGARCTRSLVCAGVVSMHTSIHSESPESSGIPRAVALTVSFALSSVTGLSCHRRLRIKFCLSPVGPTQLRKT